MDTKYQYNVNDAYMLANLAGIVYPKFGNDPVSFSLQIKEAGFEFKKFFNDDETSTQGFLATKENFAVLCFKGTADIPVDIFIDLAGRLVDGGHDGFFKAFKSIQKQVEDALDSIGDMPIYVTGHSLGGALAKVALIQMPNRNWKACYTFGSPPICDNEKSVNNIVATFLIVNAGDMVPRIMSIDSLGELGSLMMNMIKELLSVKSKNSTIDNINEYVEAMKQDMKKYSHFGEIKFFTNDGLCPPNQESLELFKKTISLNLFKAIDDHSITQYSINIGRFIDNRII